MVLCFNPVTLHAAESKPGFFERRAAGFGQRAFQDGLYDVARLKIDNFLQKYPDSSLAPDMHWLIGQCHYQLGDYPTALEIFSRPPASADERLAAGHLFWKAETLSAMNRWEEATASYRKFLKTHNSDERKTLAQIGLANAIFQQGSTADATTLINEVIDQADKPNHTHQARLLLLQFHLRNNDSTAAKELVQKILDDKPTRQQSSEASYWLGALALQADDLDAALEIFKKITDQPRAASNNLLAKAWFGKGEVLQKQEKHEAAAQAFEQAFTRASDPSLIEPALIRFLESSKATNSLAAASLKIRQFSRRTDAFNSAIGLYAIAKFYIASGNDDTALSELDHLINNHQDSRWITPAKLLMAEALARKQNVETSLQIWNELTDDPDPDTAGKARLRIAEHHASQGNHSEAALWFIKASESSNDINNTEITLQRACLALARSGDFNAFQSAMNDFKKRFPESSHLDNLLMEKARLLESAQRLDEARAIYDQLTLSHTNPEQAAEALLKLAWANHQIGDYKEAVNSLDQLISEHPNYNKMPEALYLRAYSLSLLPDTQTPELMDAYRSITDRFPNDPNASRARFQIANILFNQSRYADARREFSLITDDAPRGQLAPAALYWAGRSAMAQGDHQDAIELFEKIRGDSPLKPHARLAQIRCFMQQGMFEPAIAVSDSIMSSHPDDSSIWTEAALRKAASLFTLAADNTENQQNALLIINQVLNRENLEVHHRNEAGFLKGEILQRMQKTELALEAFLDVIYGRLLPEEISGQQQQPEFYWFIKSGFQAARIREGTGDIRGAIEIYRILERLGEHTRGEFRRTIEDLKTRHFIYEES